MIVLTDPAEFTLKLSAARANGRQTGFVPTMGALHEGHAALVRRSVEENELTIVSVFVNPTQFGPNEDFDKYPRTLEKDLELLGALGVEMVFVPTEKDIYPRGKEAIELQLSLRSMDKVLCGASRPGHFDGVLQVVTRLFHIVQPDRAYFGEKDYQQLSILRRMTEELFFPVEIRPCPTVREPDGLALSSRNRRIDPLYREQALFLSRALHKAAEETREGRPVVEVREIVEAMLADYPAIQLDYFDIRRGADLGPCLILRREDAPRGFIAAFCGDVRLIDNMPLF